MTRSAVELAALAWVKEVVTARLAPADVNARVIFANAQGPRVDLPYLTVQQIANPADGRVTHTGQWDADASQLTHTRHLRRLATIQVQAYGPNAVEMIEDLELSVNDPAVLASNTTRGIEVRGTLSAQQRIGRFSSGVPEDRVSVDFEVGHTVSRASNVAHIQTVEANSTDPVINVTVDDPGV